jgi:hypothetical protein
VVASPGVAGDDAQGPLRIDRGLGDDVGELAFADVVAAAVGRE